MNHNQLKLELKDYACISFRNDELYFSSNQRGIAPLVALCEKNANKDELHVADKVIGKAAALLCVRCSVKVLYAKVVSEAALAVLTAHDIDVSYGRVVPFIKNREGDGKCPMEKLATGTSDPSEMLLRAVAFLKSMSI